MCCKPVAALLILCLCQLTAQAQTVLPLVRSWADRPVFFATANAERYQQRGSFLFAQLQQAISQPGLSATIGYEQRLTRRWFIGGSIMPTTVDNSNTFSYSLNTSHSGKIAKWQFLKQVAYTLQSDQLNSFNFLTALTRNFSIGKEQLLRPIFSYQASIFPGSSIHPRTIDQTRAQAELAWFPKETYSIGLFFAQSTSYFIALGRFDANGNVIEPERRLNLNTAIIGLRLHLLLNLQAVDNREQMRILPY
ncbi:hypothetical protein [Rhodoflexus sp.]